MKVTREQVAHDRATVHLLQIQRPCFDGPYHHHDALELTAIDAGSGIRVIDGQVAAFAPGDLVLLPPQVAHVWWSRDDRQPAVARVLQVGLGSLQALPELRAPGLGPVLHRPALISGALADTVRAGLDALADCSGLERLGQALALLGRIDRAEADVRWLATPTRVSPGRDDARVGRVLGWVHREYARTLTVAEGAALLHVTPGAFSRAFQRLVGRPFSVCVNDVRIAEACLRLRQSARPIAEIAHDCGFPTLGHFHRQLVQRCGQGPREYRRDHRPRVSPDGSGSRSPSS
jgi:AraC-like DNA-binding protein